MPRADLARLEVDIYAPPFIMPESETFAAAQFFQGAEWAYPLHGRRDNISRRKHVAYRLCTPVTLRNGRKFKYAIWNAVTGAARFEVYRQFRLIPNQEQSQLRRLLLCENASAELRARALKEFTKDTAASGKGASSDCIRGKNTEKAIEVGSKIHQVKAKIEEMKDKLGS